MDVFLLGAKLMVLALRLAAASYAMTRS